jgi:uncharacterized protein YoxC
MVVEISLAIIATCMLIITFGFIGVAIALFRAIKKVEENVLKLQKELEGNVKEFKKTFLNVKESFKSIYGIVSLISKFKKGGK